jgi:ATP synthase subunit 6
MNLKEFLILSPLEQFCIVPLYNVDLVFFNFYITNETVFLACFFLFVSIFILSLFKFNTRSLYVIGDNCQYAILLVYRYITDLVATGMDIKEGQKYIPLFFSVFCYITGLNLFGLIPFSFSLTSQFAVTLSLSFMLFIALNFIGFKNYGLKMFTLFFPKNTEIYVGLLLTPIEILSYIFRPISLGLRLAINMIASHILLKIIAGLSWSLMKCSGALFLLHIVPLLILVPILLLEFFVAILQGLIFTSLLIVYLGDILSVKAPEEHANAH